MPEPELLKAIEIQKNIDDNDKSEPELLLQLSSDIEAFNKVIAAQKQAMLIHSSTLH